MSNSARVMNVAGLHHVRGSFPASAGDNRRKSSHAVGSTTPSLSTSDAVPNSLEALLKRAETQPQNDLSSQPPIFTDSTPVDGGNSHFAFVDGTKYPNQSSDDMGDQLQEEITILQHALINRFRGNQKTVSGCQFRVSAPQKFSKCELCDARDKALSKAKDTIRRLKNNQEKDRSQTSGVPFRVTEDNGETARIVAEREELSKRNATLQSEVLQLREQLLVQSAVPKPTPVSEPSPKQTRDLENQMKLLLDQNQMLSNVIADISDQKDAIEGRSTVLEQRLDEKSRMHAELQDLYSVHERDYTNEINNLNFQLKKQQQAHVDTLKAVQDRAAARILEATTENENLIAKNVTLTAQLRAENEALDTARSSLIKEKKASIALSNENQELTKQTKELQEEINNLQRKHSIAENEKIFDHEILEKLQTELQHLKLERDKILKSSISGSVRLCIVAPTVNVHVADKKLTFRSQVPTDALKEFLEKEILSRYTFLFRQDGEDTSPEVGMPLQDFMQRALAEMQGSIEGHIYSAMGTMGPS